MMTPDQLQLAAARLRTLEEALRWALANRLELAEVIPQDEFTHDVVFAAAPSGWLVFDTT